MLEQYDQYADTHYSGEQWLGDVPNDWGVEKLKYLFSEKRHTQNLDLQCGSISFGEVITKDDEKVPFSTKASYQEVLEGEFLVNPLNLNYDLKSLRIALSKLNVVVSAGYIVLDAKPRLNKQYYKYLMHQYDIAYMKLLGSGVRQTISFNHISNSLLPFPPPDVQTAIANFLDDKTEKIDRAIAIKEAQIARLEERKQILIQSAVTRGLDPNVQMKDSGVDWIGEIPAHWEVLPLKFFALLKSGDTISPDSFTDEGYPVFGGNGFRGFTDKYTHSGEHILIGRQGALCGNVNYADNNFYASEHAIVAHPLIPLATQWLGSIIRKANFNRLSQSAAQPGISVEVIKNVDFPLPSFEEQSEIAEFINNVEKKCNELIQYAVTQIQHLKEYRASLINAAVTGKIKVPS